MSIDCPNINIISEEEKSYTHSAEKKELQDINNGSWPSSGDYSDSNTSSSTQSWVDEAETGITKELQDQYDKFEAALYAETDTIDLPKSLQEEVKIWSEHSPHIRVRGVKAKLNSRPADLEDETYDSNYEEVIESHGTLEESLEKTISFNEDVKEVIEQCPSVEKEIIKEDLKNAIVEKLFDHAWPKVLAKFEPVIKSMSAGKKKRISQSFQKPELYLENVKNQQNQINLGRSNSSRSYMREMLSRKPFVNTLTQNHSPLSSRGLRKHCKPDQQPLESAVSPRTEKGRFTTKSGRTISTGKQMEQSVFGSRNANTKKLLTKEPDKHISLPPIEALAIAPMAPDQRSTSAMVKFTKTLPRVRPNTRNKETSKSASSHTQNGQNISKGSFSKRRDDTFLGPDLQVVGTRSATTVKNNKFH